MNRCPHILQLTLPCTQDCTFFLIVPLRPYLPFYSFLFRFHAVVACDYEFLRLCRYDCHSTTLLNTGVIVHSTRLPSLVYHSSSTFCCRQFLGVPYRGCPFIAAPSVGIMYSPLPLHSTAHTYITTSILPFLGWSTIYSGRATIDCSVILWCLNLFNSLPDTTTLHYRPGLLLHIWGIRLPRMIDWVEVPCTCYLPITEYLLWYRCFHPDITSVPVLFCDWCVMTGIDTLLMMKIIK